MVPQVLRGAAGPRPMLTASAASRRRTYSSVSIRRGAPLGKALAMASSSIMSSTLTKSPATTMNHQIKGTTTSDANPLSSSSPSTTPKTLSDTPTTSTTAAPSTDIPSAVCGGGAPPLPRVSFSSLPVSSGPTTSSGPPFPSTTSSSPVPPPPPPQSSRPTVATTITSLPTRQHHSSGASGRFYPSRLSQPSISRDAASASFSPLHNNSPPPPLPLVGAATASSSPFVPRRRPSNAPSSRTVSTSRLSLTLPARSVTTSTTRRHAASVSASAADPFILDAQRDELLSLPPTFISSSSSTPHQAYNNTPAASESSSSPILGAPAIVSQPMASSANSTSSDLATPRSISPTLSASRHSGKSSQSSVATKRMSISSRRMADLNPMASVDVAAIEAAMAAASLDQLRGYNQDNYSEVHQPSQTQYTAHADATGYQVLREPLWNRATSFTPEERISKNLTGLVPHVMESVETQCARAMKMIRSRPTNVDKYLYLSSLKAQNVDLFYRVLIDNVAQLMPLVYTPTIGDVCLQYSTLYTRPEALYISIKQRKSIRTMLRNWPYPNPEICVVTDGSRILGLGDLGINGVGISIGKLALYTAAAGIHPGKTLPIVLDCGTNNEDNLKDPLYLGLRAKRPSFSVQQEFMDQFMEAAADVFPDMVVQFEDFESEKAFNYLDRYRNKYKSFNDDVQGTGAVVLGGYIGAVNLSNVPIEEQRLVFMGAGSAGVGVAKQLVEYYTRRGLSEKEARDKFWLVDTKGLVTKDRGDKLAEHKKYFARIDNNGHQFRTLEEVIEYVKPSALVGLTATYGIFTESVVRALKASVDAGGLNRRPILFPLSNPLTKAECTFEQAVQWTDGTVIFASGSPFAPYSPKTGESGAPATTYYPNQGNNVYIFPGLGLGAILAKASRVTDEMVYISASALAGSLNADEIHHGLIYPRIQRVRDASLVVAREVMKAARRDGVSELPEEQWVEWEEWGDVALTAYIKQRIYNPMMPERASL